MLKTSQRIQSLFGTKSNDQLASLFEVRQTSQAQVQTMPRLNSGVQETGSNVELLPGERAVIARIWIGVVEKETDDIPAGDPQLLVIDPAAWKFQNKIYLLRGCLQPDPNQPTIAIRSGQVGIAFHKLANTSVGSHSSSPSEEKAGATVSTAMLLDKLQGFWDIEKKANPIVTDNFDKSASVWEISGNDIILHRLKPDKSFADPREEKPIYRLELGPSDTLQTVNLSSQDGVLLQGIILITDDLIRICVCKKVGDHMERPTEFAVTKDTNILDLRRRAAPVTELEGDWHLVAYMDKWQTERRPINLTIRANQETATLWTGKSVSRSIVVDARAKTIDFGSGEMKGGLPNQIVAEHGTYELTDDVLTIHYEYTITDSVSGVVVQKGQHTNIWKRGLREIPVE